jgi:hypothetical protein
MKLSVLCTDFRPWRRNTLAGFCSIEIPELRLAIRDLAIHQKGESRWAQLPAKPQTKDGQIVIKDGRPQYVSIIEFTDRKTRDAFSHRVIEALLDRAPHAFDFEEAEA